MNTQTIAPVAALHVTGYPESHTASVKQWHTVADLPRMMRCALEDHFELHEFPNDMARWCWTVLGDNVLGEQLALVDPYRQSSTTALRAALVNVIEDRLWGLDRVPWCRPGLELHLIESHLIAYDTGERIFTPAALVGGHRTHVVAVSVLSTSTMRGGARQGNRTTSRCGWRNAARTHRW